MPKAKLLISKLYAHTAVKYIGTQVYVFFTVRKYCLVYLKRIRTIRFERGGDLRERGTYHRFGYLKRRGEGRPAEEGCLIQSWFNVG